LNRCSTTRQAWRTAPSPGVEVDHSNRNSKIQTLGEGLAEAPLSSNKNVHSRHYSAPSLLYVLLLYYPRLADTSLRGSISLPREIGSSARITIYLSSLTSKSDTRRSVPASSPHKFLFGTKQSPPKKGEKEMNDAGEPDPYNEDGHEAVSDSSFYNPRKLQPSSSFSYQHLTNKATPSPPPPHRHTDHRHQIDLPSRNLSRPHRLSFVACIQRSFRNPQCYKIVLVSQSFRNPTLVVRRYMTSTSQLNVPRSCRRKFRRSSMTITLKDRSSLAVKCPLFNPRPG
jgi:hypothetical protein